MLKSRLTFILPVVLSISVATAWATPQVPSPELDERTPTMPDYRDLNGYFQHWSVTPEWGAGLFIGFDFQNRIVNLTPAAESEGIPDEFELDQYRDGFRYTRVRGFDAAIGPIAILEVAKTFSTWAPYGALMPVYGTRSISSQFVRTRAEMKGLSRLKVPEKRADIDAWAVHDWMTYETTGGIMFELGAGSNITVGTELRYAAAGEWTTAIEKVGTSQVFVRIAKKKLTNFSQVVGAATLVLENVLFKNQDESFAYYFDLDHEEGLNAYAQMLAGNLIPAEELAAKASIAVRSSEALRTDEKGRITIMRMGIPFFFYAGNIKGKIEVSQTKSVRNDGSTTTMEMGVALKERVVGGIFLINRRTLNDFFAASLVDRDPEGKVVGESYGGQFVWGYENAKADPGRVRSQLEKLVQQTGLHDELSIRVPEEKLGYFNASLRVTFDQDTTDELLRNGLEAFSEDGRRRAFSVGLVREYFANGRDTDGLCGHEVLSEDEIDDCGRRLEKETRVALESAAKDLAEMDRARKASNRSGFVRAFAAAGKALFANQFTFRSTLALVKDRPAKMQFTAGGERISLIKRTVEWKHAIP